MVANVRFCGSCGGRTGAEDNFCSSCGEPLAGDSAGGSSGEAPRGRMSRWVDRLIGTAPRERIVTALIVLALLVAVGAFFALD